MSKKLKIIFVQTEGWFFLSHFSPLAEALSQNGNYEGAIITTLGEAGPNLENLGLRILPLDFNRASFNLFAALKLLWNLVTILRHERPDIVHFIALKPILLGGLASFFLPKAFKVYHLTGLGYLVDGKTWLAKLRQKIVFQLVAFFTKQHHSWLITENPDDLAFLQSFGATKTNTSLFGGAGVNPDYFTCPPAPNTTPLHVAYVGRMIWSKGVDILVNAATELQNRGINIQLDLFGAPDFSNPNSISSDTLDTWNQLTNVTWHGKVSNIRDIWKKCEIAVMPTRTREGMPRAMLEAAACSRALIVTDVPGCRHFVNNPSIGLLVPADDVTSLANAIEKLLKNPELREKMGKNARDKVLENYTELHVRNAILKIYGQAKPGSST